jgi:type IV secretion system protein VirB9
MYHDGKFTYIQAHPQEPPALYEVKDGKPNLVQFEFRNGTYVVSKVLDDGYLAVGKQKLPFTRVAGAEK